MGGWVLVGKKITIKRSLAKRATPTTVRIMGMEAVSRYALDSGTSTKSWSFSGLFLAFLVLSNSAIFLLKLSLGPSLDSMCDCLRISNSLRLNPLYMVGFAPPTLKLGVVSRPQFGRIKKATYMIKVYNIEINIPRSKE